MTANKTVVLLPEFHNSLYVYVASRKGIATLELDSEARQIRLSPAPEFDQYQELFAGLGQELGELLPPTQWRHLTFESPEDKEQKSMYRAFRDLMQEGFLPVVASDDIVNAMVNQGNEDPRPFPVHDLLLSGDATDLDRCQMRSLISERVPVRSEMRFII